MENNPALRTIDGQLVPGQAPLNPRGRPKGSGWVQRVRRSVSEDDLKAIFAKLAQDARAGDTKSSGILLRFVLPMPKPVGETLDTAADRQQPTVDEFANDVISRIASGEIDITTGRDLLDAIKVSLEIAEKGELRQRIEALEAQADLA